MYISGYFLTESLLNCKGGVRDWFTYCVNKWWRFFPTAAICMILIFIITHIFPLPEERMVTISQMLMNFAIVNIGFKPVDGSHWFMSSLLQMQFLLSVILLIKQKYIRVIFISIFFIISFLMYIIDDFNNTRIDDLIRIIFCTK